MDEFEHGQLVNVVVDVDTDDEVERGVPAVDYFVLSMLQERTLHPNRNSQLAINHTRKLSRDMLQNTYLVLSP